MRSLFCMSPVVFGRDILSYQNIIFGDCSALGLVFCSLPFMIDQFSLRTDKDDYRSFAAAAF